MIARQSSAWRIRRYDEHGEPEPVVLKPLQIKRMEYLRDQWMDEDYCRVYRDRKSGEVYAVATGTKAEPTRERTSRAALSGGRQASARRRSADTARLLRSAQDGAAEAGEQESSAKKTPRKRTPRKRSFYLDPL